MLANSADLPVQAARHNPNDNYALWMPLNRSEDQRSSHKKQHSAGKGQGEELYMGRLAALKMHTDKELQILLDEITKAKSSKGRSE